MRRTDVDTAIGAADPRRRASVPAGALEDSKRELRDSIVRQPQERRRGPRSRAGRGIALGGSIRRHRAAYLALAGTLTVLAALVLGVGGPSLGPTSSPSTAQGAGLARLAKASPHLFVTLPGWEIRIAQQTNDEEGSILFASGDVTKREYLGGRVRKSGREQIELEWHDRGGGRPAPFHLAHMRFLRTGSVLGGTARLYVAGSPYRDPLLGSYFDATWQRDGRRIEAGSWAPSLREFERRLAAMRHLSAAAWVKELPGQIVSHGPTVRARQPEVSLIALRCRGPLTEAQMAGEPPAIVAYYERECGKMDG
jgi:hypothetical protein